LEQCYGANKYTLVLFVDSSDNLLYNRPDWIEKNKNLINYIKNYTSDKFKKIIKYYEKNNVGPYVGCKKTVDLCFQYSDYIIFMEDDSFVSKDYFLYYEYLFDHFMLFDDNIFAGSAVTTICKNQGITNEIEKVCWINPTEFSITKKIWYKFGHLRGKICGDVEFGFAVKRNNKYTLMCKNYHRMEKLGIGHPDSFSVLQNAESIKKQPKNIILPIDTKEIDINNYSLKLV
jgi:hypothetical protein